MISSLLRICIQDTHNTLRAAASIDVLIQNLLLIFTSNGIHVKQKMQKCVFNVNKITKNVCCHVDINQTLKPTVRFLVVLRQSPDITALLLTISKPLKKRDIRNSSSRTQGLVTLITLTLIKLKHVKCVMAAKCN